MKEVHWKLPTKTLDRLNQLAEDSYRSPTQMLCFIIDTFGNAPQTTIPTQQAFNPIKSEAPKKKHTLIPEGQPTRVVMDCVEVVDRNTEKRISLDQVIVGFAERKVEGTLAIVPSVNSGFIDWKSGEAVDEVTIRTPAGSERVNHMGLKVLNPAALVQRWLDGSYDSVDDEERYALNIIKVRDGRPYIEQTPLVPGRFEPSPEQMREYREDREWTTAQIAKFIELRSSVVPGGPDWPVRLNAMYREVDDMT